MKTISAWIMVVIVLIAAVYPSRVQAQSFDNHLYIPKVGLTFSGQVGLNPAITREACNARGLRRSLKVWNNGTSFTEIADFYRMHPQDFWFNNKDFFPNSSLDVLVIDSISGSSPVCLPSKYSLVISRNGDTNIDNRFRAQWKDTRPEWESYLLSETGVAATQTVSETYAILGFTIAVDSWWGAPVVGTLKKGDTIIGTIIKSVTGVEATPLLGEALGGFVLAEALYERIDAATTYGLVIPATILDEQAGNIAIVYYSVEPEPEELVYLGFFVDAISVAENLNIPDIIRLYTLGKDGLDHRGLVVSHKPLGIPNEKAYQWQVVKAAAIDVVAKRETLSDSDSNEYVKAVEEWLDYQYNQRERPAPVPTDPNNECPRLYNDNYLIIEALFFSMEEVEYRLRTMNNSDSLQNIVQFVEAARTFLPTAILSDWYKDPRPRPLRSKAHLTTQMDIPDKDGHHWTVEASCGNIRGQYVWLPNLDRGRLKTSITSTFPVYIPTDPAEPHLKEDFVERYDYAYLDI